MGGSQESIFRFRDITHRCHVSLDSSKAPDIPAWGSLLINLLASSQFITWNSQPQVTAGVRPSDSSIKEGSDNETSRFVLWVASGVHNDEWIPSKVHPAHGLEHDLA